jgi:hypothetical protein
MKTKNLPLIVGISLPIVFILIISIVIFTPQLFVKPQYNFIYTLDDTYNRYDYRYENTYEVEDGKIVKETAPFSIERKPTKIVEAPELYLYNVKDNSSNVIKFEEAKDYSLDPGPTSPDGYNISYQNNHDGIFELFGSNNNNDGFFISKGQGMKKLDGIVGDRYWNSRNFKLLGWIK